jgi:signal peptidase I
VNCGLALTRYTGPSWQHAAKERAGLQTNAKAVDSGWRGTIKIVVHALILAMIVRIFFYQPFNIPSGS